MKLHDQQYPGLRVPIQQMPWRFRCLPSFILVKELAPWINLAIAVIFFFYLKTHTHESTSTLLASVIIGYLTLPLFHIVAWLFWNVTIGMIYSAYMTLGRVVAVIASFLLITLISYQSEYLQSWSRVLNPITKFLAYKLVSIGHGMLWLVDHVSTHLDLIMITLLLDVATMFFWNLYRKAIKDTENEVEGWAQGLREVKKFQEAQDRLPQYKEYNGPITKAVAVAAKPRKFKYIQRTGLNSLVRDADVIDVEAYDCK